MKKTNRQLLPLLLRYIVFGKTRCRLCGDTVRFALKHLKQKHPDIMQDKDVINLKMDRILQKYFSED